MEKTISLDIRNALRQLGINPTKAMEILALSPVDQVTQMEIRKEPALSDDHTYYTRDIES